MATDLRTALLTPGLGAPVPAGGADIGQQVAVPFPDCADSPWGPDPGASSYGEPSLDRVARALDRVRRQALEPLRTAERCPGDTVGACARVWLGDNSNARSIFLQLQPADAGGASARLLLTYASANPA